MQKGEDIRSELYDKIFMNEMNQYFINKKQDLQQLLFQFDSGKYFQNVLHDWLNPHVKQEKGFDNIS